MKSGRNEQSRTAFQQLVDDLTQYDSVTEVDENVFRCGTEITLLVAFNSEEYYLKSGRYWFSLATTKYNRLLERNPAKSWLALICGDRGQYFIPFSTVNELIMKQEANRSDKRWDLYIKPEGENTAHFCVATIDNCIELSNKNTPPFIRSQNRVESREYFADEDYMSAASLSELERRLGTTVRTIRDTEQSRWVKRLYDYRCQICSTTIPVPIDFPSDGYCEGHHVRPLSLQHNGPDHSSNILALCPNHHAMMDLGVIAVDPITLAVLTIDPNEPSQDYILALKSQHKFDVRFLYYHLEHIYTPNHRHGTTPASTEESN